MAKDTVYTLFRASDAEQRSYSLAERLNAGRYLFAPDKAKTRKMDTWQDIFWNAIHVVFDNRLLKQSYLNQSALNENADDHLKTIEKQQIKTDFKDDISNRDTILSKMMTAGYWNPYAWLEALSLFWVNWATKRYDPLNDSFASSLGSEIHIAIATFFHAVAKSVNLIATPLTVILLLSAAVIFGFTPAVIAVTVLGSLAAVFSVAYHAGLSQSEDPENKRSYLYHLGMGFRHLAESIIMGLTQPIIRLLERARDLYRTNPALFWAGAVVVTMAVLAFAVFPYVGAPAILGFKLGTFAFNLLNPLLTTLGEYFTLTGFQLGVFKTAVSFVVTLGVVDLITRGVKEIAGWFNVKEAKEQGELKLSQASEANKSLQENQEKVEHKNKVVNKIQEEFNSLKDKAFQTHQILGENAPTAKGEYTRSNTKFVQTLNEILKGAVENGTLTQEESNKISTYYETSMTPLQMLVMDRSTTQQVIKQLQEIGETQPVFAGKKEPKNPTSISAQDMILSEYTPKLFVYTAKNDTATGEDSPSASKTKLHSK